MRPPLLSRHNKAISNMLHACNINMHHFKHATSHKHTCLIKGLEQRGFFGSNLLVPNHPNKLTRYNNIHRNSQVFSIYCAHAYYFYSLPTATWHDTQVYYSDYAKSTVVLQNWDINAEGAGNGKVNWNALKETHSAYCTVSFLSKRKEKSWFCSVVRL